MRTEFQGSLDGLCGLYAIANALRELNVKDRSRQLYADLFRGASRAVPPQRWADALSDGLTPDELEACAKAAFRAIRRRHSVSLVIRRPFTGQDFAGPRDFAARLSQELRKPRRVAIVCLQLPANCHWSVVRRVTGRSLTLRDSGDLERAGFDEFDVNEGRQHFRTADTFVVEHRSWVDSSAARGLVENPVEIAATEFERSDDAQELDHVEPPTTALVLRDVRLIDPESVG